METSEVFNRGYIPPLSPVAYICVCNRQDSGEIPLLPPESSLHRRCACIELIRKVR